MITSKDESTINADFVVYLGLERLTAAKICKIKDVMFSHITLVTTWENFCYREYSWHRFLIIGNPSFKKKITLTFSYYILIQSAYVLALLVYFTQASFY